MPIRGGNWNNGANAGLFALNLNNPRSNSNSNIGFRPALLYRQMHDSQESLAGTGRKGNPSPFLCRVCYGGQEEDL